MKTAAPLPETAGVYVIRCLANGRVYVGGTTNLKQRFHSQRWRLRADRHECTRLQEDWNSYGPEAFCFEILENLVAPERIDIRNAEHRWSLAMQSYEDQLGYNRLAVIERPNSPTAQSTRQKMSAFQKGRPWTETQRKNVVAAGRLRAKEYEITEPNGVTHRIKNLREFCKQNGLVYAAMCGAASKSGMYRGFKIKRLSPKGGGGRKTKEEEDA